VSSFKRCQKYIHSSEKIRKTQLNLAHKLSRGGGKGVQRAKKVKDPDSSKRMRPALTPEARENQLISLAVDLAEKQLQEGTASSQVITHYLKLGSTRERLEKERLKKENKLLDAKTKSYQSVEELKEIYADALKAMKSYSGNGDPDD
jgi:hypothetical protein